MANQPFQLDGQQLAKICKHSLPGSDGMDAEAGAAQRYVEDDKFLLSTLQALNPDYPVRLVKTDEEWYRLGGIVDKEGNRIASDLIEWAERTYIECGKNLQTLIDHAREQKLIATRQTGNTLHFVVQTGNKAEQFIQIDIDKTHEIADRFLVSEYNPPEDLEEFIDPLEPEYVETFCIGTPRYSYRRKTDVEIFMAEINKHHSEEHPVQRLWMTGTVVAPCKKPYFPMTGLFGHSGIPAALENKSLILKSSTSSKNTYRNWMILMAKKVSHCKIC